MTSTQSAASVAPSASIAPLDHILITDQLATRPRRAEDPAAEVAAFQAIAAVMNGPVQPIYDTLVELGCSLCRAHAAGLSLLETKPTGEVVFRWSAMAGLVRPYLGGETPRHFSPCGTCLDRGAPVLYAYPGRRFEYLNVLPRPIVEGLVIPIYDEGVAIGTIWVTAHDRDRRFDREDVRLMTSLASFTAAAARGARLREAAEREVDQRRAAEAALARKAAELSRSNADLTDFAYTAAHDLKEPLRGIAHYASFLMEDWGAELPPEPRERLGAIQRLATRMGTLLDDLLRFARVGQAGAPAGVADLNEIVARALDSLRPRIEQEGAIVTAEPGLPRVRCDEAQISEVFLNLVANGLKYNGSRPKRIEIGLRPPARPGAAAAFFVRDNGIGIAPDSREAVFRMFKRLHARDQYGGGSGMGLAIVEKIVRRHGGRIWVESEPGRGSTFLFTLESEPE